MTRRLKFVLWIGVAIVVVTGLVVAALSVLGSGLTVDKEKICKTQLGFLVDQMLIFREENGFLPTSDQGLAVLVEKPSRHPNPESWRQLLFSVPNDPWGHSYILDSPVNGAPHGFEIRSLGPQVDDPADDLIAR